MPTRPYWKFKNSGLRAEGTAATTGGFHLWIIELEARTFETLDVIDLGAIEIEHASLIDENLQVAKIVGLVEHAGLGFESHGIAKTGAAAANDGDPQASRLRVLHAEDFSDFANGIFSELNHMSP